MDSASETFVLHNSLVPRDKFNFLQCNIPIEQFARPAKLVSDAPVLSSRTVLKPWCVYTFVMIFFVSISSFLAGWYVVIPAWSACLVFAAFFIVVWSYHEELRAREFPGGVIPPKVLPQQAQVQPVVLATAPAVPVVPLSPYQQQQTVLVTNHTAYHQGTPHHYQHQQPVYHHQQQQPVYPQQQQNVHIIY